ncbi:MAG: hypothetical protein V3R95_10140 [Dehalococcoidia bacterium]
MTNAHPRAVLFDLDGTLVDSMPSIAVGLTVTRSAEQLREAGATHTVASLEAMAEPLPGTLA